MAARVGVEPTRRESKSRVLPLDYRAILEQMTGDDPATQPWKGCTLPTYATSANATVKRRGSRAPVVRIAKRRRQVYLCG